METWNVQLKAEMTSPNKKMGKKLAAVSITTDNDQNTPDNSQIVIMDPPRPVLDCE